MLFNSLGFVGFFVLFFLVYWTVLSRRLAGQNVWLLVGSLFFYACWDWRFLGLIGVTIVSTYVTALLAERRLPRLMTGINIVVNLAILCTFKYFNFFGENLARLMLWWGYDIDWVTLDVLLPVGISFYTFQAIGYSIDVYRRRVAAERDPVAFAVFICYFPQLVAGPIESARSLLPQIKRQRRWRRDETVEGMRQALWGLCKKVVIADACAPHVAKAFGAEAAPLATTVLGVLLFAVQIYCDFSGYCDMARGVSRCLGIDLTQNFRYPYFSSNVQQFWRRWNLSLMTWFRDYVYIPLGGSRRGQWRTYANVFVVFLLSGLWHGASWCFVAWGAYWGLIMVAYRLTHHPTGRRAVPGPSSTQGILPSEAAHQPTGRRAVPGPSSNPSSHLLDGWGILVTCWLAVIGWVIFRSENLTQATTIISRVALPLAFLVICGILAIAIYRLITRRLTLRQSRKVTVAGWLLCGMSLLIALLARPVQVVHAYLLIYITIMFIVEWYRRSLDFPLSNDAPATDWAEGRPRPVQHPGYSPERGCASTDWAEGRPRPVQSPGVFSRPWLRIAIYWLLILLVLTNYMEEVPFIYFQF